MQLLKLLFKRETFVPVAALTFGSAICFALVVARIAWTGNLRYSFLVWNLFLAWLPLVFALLRIPMISDTCSNPYRTLFRGCRTVVGAKRRSA